MQFEYTKWVGKKRFHFEKIDSTNKKAKELGEAGAEHGVLITADMQTAGSGRRGRSWFSEDSGNLYMSLLLRPKLSPIQAPILTLTAALAIAEGLNHIFRQNGLQFTTQIKWPNDILLNGRKICGILTEMILNQTQIDFVIIGIGINVANRTFPEDIKQMAASIFMETGLELEKEQIMAQIWPLFEMYYANFLKIGDFGLLKEKYESLLINKNRAVQVLDPKGVYTGTAKGITNIGELLVDTGTKIEKVSGGEVSVRGIYGYV